MKETCIMLSQQTFRFEGTLASVVCNNVWSRSTRRTNFLHLSKRSMSASSSTGTAYFQRKNNDIVTEQNKWMCRGSVVVTAYDSESGNAGSNPEWGQIYYKASITAQGLPEPSSLRGRTLGTRAAEHQSCNWGMQVDWWLQPCAVFGHSFSGISWHMPQK